MTARAYRCDYCPDEFTNPIGRGNHVRYRHPEHKNRAPKFLRTPAPVRHARASLKRDADVWPGRP